MDRSLFGLAQHPLKIAGKFPTRITYKNRSCEQEIFVIKGIRTNLLGLTAIEALGLIDSVRESEEDITKKYPSVFQGLGQEY